MLVQYKQKTNTKRFASRMIRPGKNVKEIRSLIGLLPKKSGRSGGKVTVRHQGGRHKRYYRLIDFQRSKREVSGKVMAFEYDPNRNVDIALIQYDDGEKRYILAPKGLKVGDTIMASDKAEVKLGHAMKLKSMPVGTVVHNVELYPGKGGQLGRSAGTALTLQAKESGYGHLKMPSGEVRMVSLESYGTVGTLGNEEWKNMVLGKAGRARHMGIRPTVRGVAQDPRSHAHGGGEGRSGVGRKTPMTVYGRPAVGNTRKKNKWTDKYILKKRNAK